MVATPEPRSTRRHASRTCTVPSAARALAKMGPAAATPEISPARRLLEPGDDQYKNASHTIPACSPWRAGGNPIENYRLFRGERQFSVRSVAELAQYPVSATC